MAMVAHHYNCCPCLLGCCPVLLCSPAFSMMLATTDPPPSLLSTSLHCAITEVQVANILTIDLPDDEPGHTPGPAGEEEDELDTPLALRFAKSSAERAAAWGSGGSSGGRAAGSGVPRGGGAGPAGAAAADRRSRLALASGPREQEAKAVDEQDAMEEADSDSEQAAMQVDEPTAAQQEQQVGEDQQPPGQQQQQQEEADGGEQRAREAAAAKGVAARFSVRQLVQHPERPVLVHKGTPLPGALPSPGDVDK